MPPADAPLSPALADVLAAWPVELRGARAQRATSGLIQDTYLVTLRDGARLVVQRIHPIFDVGDLEVLADIDAVTAHLLDCGLETPRLVRTRSGAFYVRDAEGRAWRALTYLDGYTVDRVETPGLAAEAGALVARFHAATETLRWEFRFRRAGVHDTTAHLLRLEAAYVSSEPIEGLGSDERDRLRRLAGEILATARRLPPIAALRALRPRVTHGDLKISNVLFFGQRARALLDLDTLGRQSVAYELGDALRSWCNPLGEDVERTRFDLDLFAAAVGGYASAGGASLLGRDEVELLVPGLATVCVELAARFCVDAFEDRYFGWDPTRFPSRREHDRVRAAGQLHLARAVLDSRTAAEDIVHQRFRPT